MSQPRKFWCGLILLVLVPVSYSQVSPEEAQRRLNARLSSRPSTTQPMSETDRLRAENRRLRDENLELQTEIAQLRDALAKASPQPTTGPATQPTASSLQTRLIGTWQGGALAAANAFTLEFLDDGTYRQIWTVGAAHPDTGHWNAVSDVLIEMWTGAVQPRRPNQWAIAFDGDTKVTLTPVLPDGSHGKAMVLSKTQ